MGYKNEGSIVIASGGNTSSAIDVGSAKVVSFVLPVLTSGTITLQGSADNVTYYACYNKDWSGNIVTSGVINGSLILTAPIPLGVRYLRLVSSGAQSDEKTIRVFLKN